MRRSTSLVLTRREALVGIGLAAPLAALGFAAGEFWDEKQPGGWTDKEVQRMLTKSPWAKEADMDMDPGDMGGRGMGGRGMGGPMGGRGMEGPGGRGGMESRAVVRWESAEPIREAGKSKLPREASGSYLIRISGLAMLSSIAPTLGSEGLETLKQNTFLQRKGRSPVAPSYITVPFDEAGVMLFYFPANADPISVQDREVVFQTKLEMIKIKAKFSPKDMLYKGKLAL
jgi:hypothetical protein